MPVSFLAASRSGGISGKCCFTPYSDFAWKTLAIRWGLFFIAMAIWNEFLWRSFTEATWANWKLGNIVITFLFALANTPYTLKHMTAPAEADDA